MSEKVSHIQRVHHETDAIAKQNAYIRDVISKSLEILRSPVPDAFLGRKTQEPFPKEEELG